MIDTDDGALTLEDIASFGLEEPPRLSLGDSCSGDERNNENHSPSSSHSEAASRTISNSVSVTEVNALQSRAAESTAPLPTELGSASTPDAAAYLLGGARPPITTTTFKALLCPSSCDLDPATRNQGPSGDLTARISAREGTPERAQRVLRGGPVTGNRTIDDMLRDALRTYAQNAGAAFSGVPPV